MLLGLLLVLATDTATVGGDLSAEAEAALEKCGLSQAIARVGPGGAREPWTVSATEVEGKRAFEILVRIRPAQPRPHLEEWRSWLLAPNGCRLLGLGLTRLRGQDRTAALYYPLATPPTPALRSLLLERAEYRPCEAATPPLSVAPKAQFGPPSGRSDDLQIEVLGPEPIEWHSGLFRDPRLCWSKRAAPDPPPAGANVGAVVQGGPSYEFIDLGGSAAACRLMGASCDLPAMGVDGLQVRLLSIDARGAALLEVETGFPRRHAVPVSDPVGLRLLGRYEGNLWLTVPGEGGLGFTLVSVDLAAGKTWRIAIQPWDQWILAGTRPTGLSVRDANYSDALANAETWRDRQAVEDRFPAKQITWKRLKEALTGR